MAWASYKAVQQKFLGFWEDKTQHLQKYHKAEFHTIKNNETMFALRIQKVITAETM